METIVIQETFLDVIKDVINETLITDTFWVNRRKDDSTVSEQYIIEVTRKDGIIQFRSTDADVTFREIRSRLFEFNVQGSRYLLKTPVKSFPGNKKAAIDSVAISPHRDLIVSADSNYDISVMDINTGDIRRNLKQSHYSDITDLKIFPSNQVLLSTSSDLQIKIWSILDGSNPRTLVGHTARITQAAIVGRGRNILTSSLDGSLRLWECGSGECVYEYRRVRKLDDGANCFVLTTISSPIPHSTNKLEYETDGKSVFVGYESGVIQQYVLCDHSQGISLESVDGSSVTSLLMTSGVDDSDVIVAGYSNGYIRLWSLDNTKSPKFSLRVSTSPIITMAHKEDSDSIIVSGGSDCLLEFEMKKLVDSETPSPIHYVGLTEGILINDIATTADIVVVGGKYGTLARY